MADEGWYKQKFIIWAEESVEALLVFGPLLEKGMSLHELKQHTSPELIAMVTILGRMNVIENGKMLESKREGGKPLKGLEVRSYTKYLEEMERINKSVPKDTDQEDEESESDNIDN